MGAILALGAATLLFAAPAGAQAPERQLTRPLGPEKSLTALTPARADVLTNALRQGRIGAPRYALERATSLFHLDAVRARYGAVHRPDPHSATLILRDLSLRLDELSPADKVKARRLLARPTEMGFDPNGSGYTVAEAAPACTDIFCIHYVASTVDAPPLSDVNPADGFPDWVVSVAATLADVWTKEVDALGYRAPLSDALAKQWRRRALRRVPRQPRRSRVLRLLHHR